MKISVLLACSSLLLAGTAIPAATAAPLERARATTVKAPKPSPNQVVTDASVTVTGKVIGDRKDRTVRLQLRTPQGWLPVGKKTRTDEDGKFALTVPTDWYYDTAMRVRTPKTRTHRAAASKKFRMRVKPAYNPGGKPKHWKVYSKVARWNPCKPVTYRVNTTGAPDGGLQMVKDAIAVLHKANGIRFKYLGSTDAIPFRDDGGQEQSPAKLDIAWAGSDQVDELQGDTIGWGGIWWNSRLVAYRGGVALRRDADLGTGTGPGATWTNLILHELGHVMGMDHVKTEKQVMYPQIPFSPGRYEAGDLQGLQKKGLAQGCWNGVRHHGRIAVPGFASAP